jgi:hypothetical protein
VGEQQCHEKTRISPAELPKTYENADSISKNQKLHSANAGHSPSVSRSLQPVPPARSPGAIKPVHGSSQTGASQKNSHAKAAKAAKAVKSDAHF